MTGTSDIKTLISPELVIVARRLIYGIAFIFFLITNWGNTLLSGSMLLEYGFAQLAGHQDPGNALGETIHVRLLADTTIRFLMFFLLAHVIDRMLERLSFRLCDTAYFNQRFETLARERLKILQDKTNLMEYETRLCDYSDGLVQQFGTLETRIQTLIRLSNSNTKRKAAKAKPVKQASETRDIFEVRSVPPTTKPSPKKFLAWQKPNGTDLPEL